MKRIMLISMALLFATPALAETAFQFAAPALNLPDDPIVNGMRLSFLHGKNQSTRGFDVGLLSVSQSEHVSGLQLIGGISRITGDMDSGVAFSLINYHSGRDSGVNGAFINILNEAGGAFNTGFVIVARGSTGVDLGGFNMSESSTAQIGFINITKKIKSFQFGFINVAENGFLPVFPIFNFPVGDSDSTSTASNP